MKIRGIVSSAALAWLAAAVGAWSTAAACRTMEPVRPPAAAPPIASAGREPGGTEPGLRVGILVDGPRVSIGADEGLALRLQLPGEVGVALATLPRATFRATGIEGRVLLLETGQEIVKATVTPAAVDGVLQADSTSYRGLLEVRPGAAGTITVVNLVPLEEYLRGVVPNELSPLAFPEIEALKAQAVAARTYALAHRGDYSSKGFDVCATQACQVYRGQSSEHPLTDRAVAETAGVIATWRGRPINAYYTSTCGGHTEDGKAIFADDGPYLRGVACAAESASRHAIHGRADYAREALSVPGAVRDLALLEALGVVGADDLRGHRLNGIPRDAELRAWVDRLRGALHRDGCASAVGGALARRATFARFLVDSLCWRERAERLLAPGDAEYLLRVEDVAQIAPDERHAVSLLAKEGLLAAQPDNTLRPGAALSRLESLALLAGAALRAGSPLIREGTLVGLAGGELRVLDGEQTETHPVDEGVRLIRDLDGVHSATRDLTLAVGDRVVYVLRDGRVAYLEAEQRRDGAAADHASRYYNWQVRLTPAQVEKSVARYGAVGRVRDLVPKRIGVSGRVIELAVVGSTGELVLRGLEVRWGLGLRENLFVIDREKGGGEVERFVVTGKGWGHGVGLCQVGAFGMARAGSDYQTILRHYYTGVAVERADGGPAPVAAAAPPVR